MSVCMCVGLGVEGGGGGDEPSPNKNLPMLSAARDWYNVASDTAINTVHLRGDIWLPSRGL